MAVRVDDALSKILGETEYQLRHDIWLWYTLIFNDRAFSQNNYSDTGMRDKMANYLQTRTSRAEDLLKERRKQLVPKSEIEWIAKDRRIAVWATKEIQIATGHSQLTHNFDLTEQELPVAILDVWQSDLTQKTNFLRNLEQRWKNHKRRDNAYAWFYDDAQKYPFTWDWLTKNSFGATMGLSPFETLEDILIFFDNANYPREKEELYIGKIKKGWNQKKYRENLKGKAQYNFVLSDKAIASLENLASRYEVSRARLLEILIEMETEKNDHIPEKLRTQQLLN